MSGSASRNRRPLRRAFPHRRTSEASSRLARSLSASLADRWLVYTRELGRCRARFSERAVHDLRVALRRLISALDMACAVAAGAPVRRVRREFRRLLGSCSALRDVQVQLLLVKDLHSRHPQVAVIRTMLLVRERRLVARLRKEIARVRTGEQADSMQMLREAIEKALGDSSRARLRRAAVAAAATAAFAEAVRRRTMIDRRPASIHALRVAFKKFRYKAETLQPLLPWIDRERLRAMHAYQTRMGEIQDLEVFLGVVREQAMPLRRRGTPAFRPVVLELLARRRELVRVFHSRADELYEFWSVPVNTPESAFSGVRRKQQGTKHTRR